MNQSHIHCTNCGSSDALTEYDSGSYCFACTRFTPKHQSKSFFTETQEIKNTGPLRLPAGASCAFSRAAENYLLSYHVHKELQVKYRLKYVPFCQAGKLQLWNRIALPSYNDKGDLEFYQLRTLGNDDGPKYFTVGNKTGLFWSKEAQSRTIVIVEDMISAIRVGEEMSAVSLLGTATTKQNLVRLATDFDRIIIWLDSDRPGVRAAQKLKKQLELLTTDIEIITTKRDPKCLFRSEIRKHLAQCAG